MNLIITIVAVIIVVAGVLYARQPPQSSDEQVQAPLQQNESTDSNQEEEEETPTATPTQPRLSQPTSTPTPKTNYSVDESQLKYPGSVRVRVEGETVVYESQDDSDTITDWYKTKIAALGMSAKSFVKTRTNDNVLNKLVGADSSREVRVEISKPAGSSTVTIKVSED